MTRLSPRSAHGSGFTLVEVLLASVAAAMIMVSVYTVFSRAIKLRDDATSRTRQAQIRQRAVRTIRHDLANALISGGILAAVFESNATANDANVTDSAVPGYFKFTTTTGHDTEDDLYGDVQQVEYYIAKDPASSNPNLGGHLVRLITRDLLDGTATDTREESILPGVQSFQVTFYDGTNWDDTWQISPTTGGSGATGSSGTSAPASSSSGSGAATNALNLPQAVRIDIQQSAPSAKASTPPPLEILVPWTTQPFATPTPASS